MEGREENSNLKKCKPCSSRLKTKLLAKNKNSGKQTKILTNKPKCRQTTQFDKTKKWFKSLEVQALLIALKKDD